MLPTRAADPSARQRLSRLRDSLKNQADQEDARRSRGRFPVQGGVDSILIEQFSVSDSASNPSSQPTRPIQPPQPIQAAQTAASYLEILGPSPYLRRGSPTKKNVFSKTKWWNGWLFTLVRSVGHGLVGRRAGRLLNKLIMVDGKEDRPAVAKLQRYNAAAGLVRIMEEEPDGGEIVARKFVQSTSRIAQCTRALFKLSDYELDEFGYEAISPVSTSIAYRSLLAIVLERTTASSFFQIISTLMNDREGPAAILYLATTDRRTFFAQVDRQLIFKFSSTLVLIQEPLSRKWYCGVKLLCMLLMSPGHAEWESEVPLQLHLFNILRDLIHGVMENSPPGVSEASENHFIYRGLPVLPLIAACCRRIEEAHLPISSPSVPFKSFLELLIDFVRQQLVPRILKTERALAGLALMLLFQFPSVVELFSKIELSRFASLIMNMVLHPWTLRFQEADRFERVSEAR